MTAAKKAAAPAPKKAAVATRPSPTSKAAAPAARKVTGTKRTTASTGKATSTTKAAPSAKKAPVTKKPAAPTRAAATKAPPATTATSTKAASTKAAGAKATAAKAAAPAPKKAPLTKAAATKAPPAKKAAAPAKKAEAAKAVPRKPTVGPYAKEPKFLEEQRALLLEERGIYAGQAHDLRAEADSLALEREPGDVQFDEESGEGGTVTVDRERNLALSAQASAAVEEIDDAIRKIERKTYGACERCHQPIPKARLRALPFARLCVACKSGGLSRR